MTSSSRGWLAVLAAMTVIAAPARGAIEAIEVVVETGEAAPGTSETFTGFGVSPFPAVATLDALGRMAFGATLSGGDGAQTSVWSWSGSGAPELVACECLPLPGVGSATLAQVDSIGIDGAGGVAFRGRLAIGGAVTVDNDECVFAPDDTGALALLLRVGAPAPGVPGYAVGDLGFPSYGEAGMVVAANLDDPIVPGPSARGVVYRQDEGGSLVPVALDGTAAPGGGWFCNPALPSAAGNALGDVAFWSPLSATADCTWDGDPPEEAALFGPDATHSLQPLVRRGDPAPGALGVFRDWSLYDLDDVGGIAFGARLEIGGEVHAGNDSGVWVPDGVGGLRLLAREGASAPGTGGGSYGNLYSGLGSVLHDAAGGTLFSSRLEAGTRGIWGAPIGRGTRLVALEGQPAPGVPGGVITVLLGLRPANAAGQLVFGGRVDVAGVSEDALWTRDLASGATELLLRDGDAVELAPGDVRTLGTAGLLPRSIEGVGWNDAGQLAAVLRFTDGSEALARLTVPEAGSGAAAAAFALGALARRSRR